DELAPRAVATLEAAAAPKGIRAAEKGTLASLNESMRRNGIHRSVALPVATKPEHVPSINRHVITNLMRHEELVCFGALHPLFTEWRAEIPRLKDAGIKGVKLHAEFQQFAIDAPAMMPVYRALADAGLVLMMHMGEEYFARCESRATPAMLARVLEQAPGLKVIAAHGGAFLRWREFIDAVAGHPDVWVDLAYLPGYIRRETLDELLEKHGSARVLFGSDFPWMAQDTVLAFVRGLGLPSETEAAILGGNATALLGL
ncbi:amidohydrolase family protein, partial [bacterium]|nr:amidohydrolase family protein [bacterium]